MKHIIFAAALLALCSPAFATGQNGFVSAGTSATSTSGVEASITGRGSASGHFSDVSHGSAGFKDSGTHSDTSSKSWGGVKSTKGGAADGYSTGTSGAFTGFGSFNIR